MAQKAILSPEQDMAANPSENVWVQANAGTGKTSVLIQRLLRILFRSDDIMHTGILCLTYTNAAAGEMRNRILSALRTWAMSSDDDLRELLSGVALGENVSDDDIAHAREIFFKYIDNPDVLKIKTIHGFCEEILRRFPIESGVSPSWSLVSDAPQRVLLQDVFNKMINTSQRNVSDNAQINDAFAHIVGRVSEYSLDDLLDVLSSQYKYFFSVNDIVNYRKYFIDTTRKFLNLDTPICDGFSVDGLRKIAEMAEADANSSKKPAVYLIKIINSIKQYLDKTINFSEYKAAWLRADCGKIANVVKKDYLVAEQERVYQIAQRNLSQMAFEDTVALFDLSAAFASVYQSMKRERNLLDFEDLILYTRKLFSNPDTMGWVLSQLNISLSHILVDEAQDTSPMQWDIMRMLSGDFFADGDVAGHNHSLFVVGDTKQSIYGFQGADPHAFAASRDEIAAQITQNFRTIREIPLAQSFRTLGAILYAVDCFFDDAAVVDLSGFANNAHRAFRGDGGLVELHKLVSKRQDEKTINEYVSCIADKIKMLIDSGEFAACDIMVLVQQRHPMAAPLATELKRRNIDVAGSDRIVLPNFPAVRDMLNLVRFCLNSVDDFSLCCVLKSPIFRLNEREIFDLCKIKNDINSARRAENKNAESISVYSVLENARPDIYTRLTEYISWAEILAPYSFFMRVLETYDVRASMIAALGTQIIDPLEEFLTICLSYERTQPGTLYHFIKWFITGGSEIKRDMDASSGVRIVTVHGSKGLEAPVVFLIDTVRVPKSEKIVPIPDVPSDKYPAPWVWLVGGGCQATVCDVARDAAESVGVAEYYRLLYVAMTRARDRLYIYGFTPNNSAPDASWHNHLWRVFGAIPNAEITNETIRITHGNKSA